MFIRLFLHLHLEINECRCTFFQSHKSACIRAGRELVLRGEWRLKQRTIPPPATCNAHAMMRMKSKWLPHLKQGRSDDGSETLNHDVQHGLDQAYLPGHEEASGYGRVDVTAGDVTDALGHSGNGHAKGQGDADEVGLGEEKSRLALWPCLNQGERLTHEPDPLPCTTRIPPEPA